MTDFKKFVANMEGPRMFHDASGVLRLRFYHGQWTGSANIDVVNGSFLQKDIDNAANEARRILVEKLQRAQRSLDGIEPPAGAAPVEHMMPTQSPADNMDQGPF